MKEIFSEVNEIKKPDMNVAVINGYNDPDFLKYKDDIQNIQEKGEFLDYDSMKSFHFSSINGEDKFTKRLCDCTGVVLFGKRKESDEVISLISHVDVITEAIRNTEPKRIEEISSYKEAEKVRLRLIIEKLKQDIENSTDEEEIEIYDDDLEMDVSRNKVKYLNEGMEDSLQQLKNLDRDVSSEEYEKFEKEMAEAFLSFVNLVDLETVAGTIVGGQVIKESELEDEAGEITAEKNRMEAEMYDKSIVFWKEQIDKYFGLKPDIAHPPLTFRRKKHGTSVFVDTQKRKVFAVYESAQ